MLKVLGTSPLRLLAVILFMVMALPSQKVLGAAPMTAEEANEYVDNLIGLDSGYNDFDEATLHQAAKVIAGSNETEVNDRLKSIYQHFIKALQNDPKKREFLKTYKNTDGKTLLHQLRDLGGMPGFFNTVSIWMKDQERFKSINQLLDIALKEKDGEGKTPLDGVDVNNMIISKLVVINPTLLIMPTSSDGITPLIRLALTLGEKPESERKELYAKCKERLEGTTIDLSEADRLIANADKVIGEKLTLDDTTWKTIINHPYNKVRFPEFTIRDFYDHALSIAAATDQGNPLFNSFWQQDTKKAPEANKLWQGYFDEYDQILDEKNTRKGKVVSKKDPFHVRVLEIIQKQDELDPILKTKALENIISGRSTFRPRFEGGLSCKEITVMRDAIRSYARRVYSTLDENKDISDSDLLKDVINQIKVGLMPSQEKFSGLDLTSERKLKLANHQMTCTALAVNDILFYSRTSRVKPEEQQKLIQDSLGNSITFDFGSIKTDYAGRIKRFDNLYDEKTAEDED